MIIYDKYKIAKDHSDWSLWELKDVAEYTKIGKNGAKKTGKTVNKWVHIGYYASPWSAFLKLSRIMSFDNFENMNDVSELLNKMDEVNALINKTAVNVIAGIIDEDKNSNKR